jgi:ferredoxin-type protein NapF
MLQVFRGRADKAIMRPPWSVPEESFIAGCTRCGACVDACPQQILHNGDGGFPQIDFRFGECTFCQACATACPAGMFVDPATSPSWSARATISTACLTHQGVYCNSCRDCCAAAAIEFHPAFGTVARPDVDAGRCTGCGGCVAACPTGAISVSTAEDGCR